MTLLYTRTQLVASSLSHTYTLPLLPTYTISLRLSLSLSVILIIFPTQRALSHTLWNIYNSLTLTSSIGHLTRDWVRFVVAFRTYSKKKQKKTFLRAGTKQQQQLKYQNNFKSQNWRIGQRVEQSGTFHNIWHQWPTFQMKTVAISGIRMIFFPTEIEINKLNNGC